MIKLIIPFLLIFASCSGYQVKTRDNPFLRYEIRTISIPMFQNRSNLANVSGEFTKKIYQLLAGYKGLKVVPGARKSSDAVLLGIIDSPQYKNDTVEASGKNLVDSILVKSESIDSRETFFIPTGNQIKLKLRLILIKSPTDKEIEALNSKFGELITRSPRIILNETLPITYNFTRELLSFETNDTGGNVTFTRNRGNLREAIISMANSASETFKSVILYAF